MCVDVCVDICVCVDVCVDVCVNVYVDVCVDVCVNVCVDVCVDVHVCLWTCVREDLVRKGALMTSWKISVAVLSTPLTGQSTNQYLTRGWHQLTNLINFSIK